MPAVNSELIDALCTVDSQQVEQATKYSTSNVSGLNAPAHAVHRIALTHALLQARNAPMLDSMACYDGRGNT